MTEKFVGCLALFPVAGLIMGAFLLWLVAMMIVTANTENSCLRAGYAESSVSVYFDRYCVKHDYMGVMVAIPMKDAVRNPIK